MEKQYAGTFVLREMWPLFALRYVIVTAGVFAWLWEVERTAGFIAASLLFSLAVGLELVVFSGRTTRMRSVLAGVQLVLALGAAVVHPSAASAIMCASFLAGVAFVAPLPHTGIFSVAAAAVMVTFLEAPTAVLISLLSMFMLAAAVGRLFQIRAGEAHRHGNIVAQLEQAQARLAEFAETARDLAVAEERQHMAEELHDTLGHALVGTLLQVQVAKKLLRQDPEKATERLAAVEDNIRATLDQVRQALRRGPTRRAQLPLHLALESLAADFAAAGGPKVELTWRPDPEDVSDVPEHVADVLYRTTQEALTNAVRHGRATHVKVELEAAGPRVYLRIVDNGVGADNYTPGMGLVGMVNRVQSVGGTLRFETAPGKGFAVEVGVRRR